MGLRIPDRSWLRPGGGHAGNGCRVMEFNMAGSDDTAQCQHVQCGSLLFRAQSAQIHVMDLGREEMHRVFLRC